MTKLTGPQLVPSGTAFGDVKVVTAPTGQRITLIQASDVDRAGTSVETISIAPARARGLIAALADAATEAETITPSASLGPDTWEAPPPRPETTNADRARWALAAFIAYAASHRCDEDDQTTLADLLCDLLHFADANDLDFDSAMGRAERSYHEEVAEAAELAEAAGS
jgi:hypothetical protein